MSRLALIVLCVTCHALALSVGCGGGDDSTPPPDAGTPPPQPPPDAGPPDAGSKPDAGPTDLVPPDVASTMPANNAVAVPPESVIEVLFTEPMQTDRGVLSLSPSTGLPNNGTLVARPELWDAARRKVTFSFPQGLPRRAQLTATVANFADTAGNPLSSARSFTFTVSDGNPPRVVEARPVEGASQVPLNTAEVSFTFNEPMDPSVGALTPSGGLTLGPASWKDNLTVTAPITGGLVYNGSYSVRLSGFRNVHQAAFDGAPYLGDGKLDFGTGPDTARPSVREASPAEGATGVIPDNTSFIVITFSEPMDASVGRADLVYTGSTTVLTPTWAPDGFSVTYDVRQRLRYNSLTRVVLTGFKDRVGNLLDPAPYLGDGELDFQTAADTIKPYVESTTPAEGTQDLYPLEVYATGTNPATGYRKVFTFRFNEPMDVGIRRVILQETYNPPATRPLDGTWSADGMTLTVTVLPPSSSPLPLLEEFVYNIDLSGLRDRNGNGFDLSHPSLGDGRLDFRTSTNSPGLNHACEHAILLNPIAVTATGSTQQAPRADTLHSRYGVTLPSNGTSFSGYVRMELQPETLHSLYLDGTAQVTVTDAANNTNRPVSQFTVPPACAQITQSVRFDTPQGPAVYVRFGPTSESTVRFIPEQFF